MLCKIIIIEMLTILTLAACRSNKNESDKPEVNADKQPSAAPAITAMPVNDYKTDNSINSQQPTGSSDEAVAVRTREEPDMFSIDYISEDIKDRINGKTYGKDCTVPYEDLRYVKVLYWGFDNMPHEGELIVNKAIAEDIADIFKELYEHKYPIEKMVLVDEYNADDNASMAANNSSAFNFRIIDNGSGRLSNHSYGLAIDINPLYNPYVRTVDGKLVVSPEESKKYTDRSIDNPYYINKDDICYKAFTKRGFSWGGDWENTKDYQHFEKKVDSPSTATKH